MEAGDALKAKSPFRGQDFQEEGKVNKDEKESVPIMRGNSSQQCIFINDAEINYFSGMKIICRCDHRDMYQRFL